MVLTLTKLADEMKRQNMRPEDLASKTGLSVRTILNARSGKSVSYGTATLIAMKLKLKATDLTAEEAAPVDPMALAVRIRAFLAKYGKRSAGDETVWSSPDAAELEVVAELLEVGRTPDRHPWSEWGSGGYGPYTSREGQAEHDEILRLVGEVIKEVKA